MEVPYPANWWCEYPRGPAELGWCGGRRRHRACGWRRRHTYASEVLRAGVGFPALMKLLGHTDPGMTLCYLEVAAADLQREYPLARSRPRHLVPQPKSSLASVRTGLDGVIDSLVAAQHRLEMFRRPLPDADTRACLDRLSNRLTKIIAEARKLATS